jgi:hypothetical protein
MMSRKKTIHALSKRLSKNTEQFKTEDTLRNINYALPEGNKRPSLYHCLSAPFPSPAARKAGTGMMDETS